MSKENPNYYAIIPANVRYDQRLNGNEKILYGEITALSSKDGFCWAKNVYFSRLYGVSKDTISKWICKLVDCGYLTREIIRDESERIVDRKLQPTAMSIPLPPIDAKEDTYGNDSDPIDEKGGDPIDENDVENNTSKSNNTSNNNMSFQRQVFEIWIAKSKKSQALVTHKKYSRTAEKAINKAIQVLGKDIDKFELLIDRFINCFEKSQGNEYPIKSRTIYEFFGQKVKDSVLLICQEYEDDGPKWQNYSKPRNSKKKKKGTLFD